MHRDRVFMSDRRAMNWLHSRRCSLISHGILPRCSPGIVSGPDGGDRERNSIGRTRFRRRVMPRLLSDSSSRCSRGVTHPSIPVVARN